MQVPLDSEALGRLRRTMGSEREYLSMLQEFLSSSSRLAGELDAAQRAGRRQDVERVAHTLKSMARMVGAFPLAEACAAAEADAALAPLPDAQVRELGERLALAQGAVRGCIS